VLTIDGARDDWHGAWPPAFGAQDGGQPLAEARRPPPAAPAAPAAAEE
jgi:hypothetical protein